MSLTNDQFFLLGKLCSYVTDNRRTDKLAQFLSTNPAPYGGKKWTTSHVPFIGLQLRDMGYVTTYKDNSQYARWDVTPLGRAAFVEHNNTPVRAERLPDKAAPVTIGTPPPLGYLVTADDGSAQSEVFDTRSPADKMADKWAKEEPGTTFLVCAVLNKFKASVVVTKE